MILYDFAVQSQKKVLVLRNKGLFCFLVFRPLRLTTFHFDLQTFINSPLVMIMYRRLPVDGYLLPVPGFAVQYILPIQATNQCRSGRNFFVVIKVTVFYVVLRPLILLNSHTFLPCFIKNHADFALK